MYYFLFINFSQAYRVLCHSMTEVISLLNYVTDLSANGAKPLLGCRWLSAQTASPYPHTTPVHTKAHKLVCVHPPAPSVPSSSPQPCT